MSTPTTRHLTILFTDIKGFTDKTSHRSRADIQRLLDDHRDVVLPVLQAKGGHLVKTIGDAFLMTYDSPTDAVLAGVAVQEALAKHNQGVSASDRIEIRVAINAGEVNLSENDVFGEAVNIAARIEGVAEAGEVYFTEAVYLAMNKTEVPSSEIGLLQLKGIPEKVRVYKVRRETPLGVGQLPARPAAVLAAPSFAPGEKARLASAPAACGAVPTRRRRVAALAVDGILCSMLVSILLGGGKEVRLKGESGRQAGPIGKGKVVPAVKIGIQGVHVDSGEGDQVRLDKKGLQVKSGEGDRVEIGLDGIQVVPAGTKEDGVKKVVLHDDDDFRVSVEERPRKKSLFPLGWVAYNFLFLWLLSGATPGKKLLKLRVVSVDGAALDWRRSILRALMSLVSGSLLMLGYLWAFWDSQRRTWHDAAAGTRVVSAE